MKPGYYVAVEGISVPSNDGKVVRAPAMGPTVRNGLLLVVDGAEWLYERKGDEGFVAEVFGFPFSKRSDRVDALSQHVTFYLEDDTATKRTRAMNVL